jgi:hypothetical protein
MAGEEGDDSAARKLSTATSILARTCRRQPTRARLVIEWTDARVKGGADDDVAKQEERAVTSAGGRMSAEQRRRSAPNSDAAATSATAVAIGEKPLRVMRGH